MLLPGIVVVIKSSIVEFVESARPSTRPPSSEKVKTARVNSR